jgi:hypothetical protein
VNVTKDYGSDWHSGWQRPDSKLQVEKNRGRPGRRGSSPAAVQEESFFEKCCEDSVHFECGFQVMVLLSGPEKDNLNVSRLRLALPVAGPPGT